MAKFRARGDAHMGGVLYNLMARRQRNGFLFRFLRTPRIMDYFVPS